VRVSAGGPPSGVVTFLFTDIEGSTRRWETDADAMRVALLAHDDVLRTAIKSHGGYLFSHTGDGVVAAFASPRSAVDAAVAAQRELELPVRLGLATGEAELRDGDYFGTVLNRAARVMAAGHGGQILVADSMAVLLGGIDLVDLGPRRLRDLPIPVGVFQIRAPGLRTDFAPLRALDRARETCGPRSPASSGGNPRLPMWKRLCEPIGWAGTPARQNAGPGDPDSLSPTHQELVAVRGQLEGIFGGVGCRAQALISPS
jgi:class 3 adenylate cyclase